MCSLLDAIAHSLAFPRKILKKFLSFPSGLWYNNRGAVMHHLLWPFSLSLPAMAEKLAIVSPRFRGLVQ